MLNKISSTNLTGKPGKFIVLSGPSGVGKSTLIKEALLFYGSENLVSTTSYTTRDRREKELENKDYYFVSKKKFEEMREKKYFAEWACVYHNYYGTSINQIYTFWNKGKTIIKDLDLQGAELIKKRFPSTVRVFILPPSLDSLIERIHKRQSISENTDILIRREKAQQEIQKATEFDYQIVNKVFHETFEKLKKIIETCLKST